MLCGPHSGIIVFIAGVADFRAIAAGGAGGIRGPPDRGVCFQMFPTKFVFAFGEVFLFVRFLTSDAASFICSKYTIFPPPLRLTPSPPVVSPGLAVTAARPR